MLTLSKILRWSGFSLMAAFGLLGSAFVVGETFADPGGWEALLLVALWAVPMVLVCILALRTPDRARRLLLVAVAVVAALWVWFAAAPDWWRDLMDDRGPVLAVATFAVGVAVAFLGLRDARSAGLLLVVLGVLPLVAIALAATVLAGNGPGPSGALGGSGGAAAVPTLVTGFLYLLAYAAGRGAARPGERRGPVSDRAAAPTGR